MLTQQTGSGSFLSKEVKDREVGGIRIQLEKSGHRSQEWAGRVRSRELAQHYVCLFHRCSYENGGHVAL